MTQGPKYDTEELRKKYGKYYSAFVTLTYQCQCDCKHCGIELFKKNDQAKILNTEEIKHLVLDQLQGCGISGAYLFGGEPTVHKDFLEFIRYGKKIGLFTRFDTNGVKLADKDFAKATKDAGISFLFVSLDSANPEVHDKFRGRKGTWNSAVQGIKNCVELGIKVGIISVVTKQSLLRGDTKKIIQLGKDLGVFRVQLLTPMLVGRWHKSKELKLTKEEMKQFLSLLESDFVFWEDTSDGTAPFFCATMAKGNMATTVYGDVQPCCYIPITFGNVRNEPLKTITERMWSSSFYKQKMLYPFDCPMNDESFRKKILKLTERKSTYPVEYDESIFSSK
ncbi:radical SAM/SPASM domain-containing protein [Candidatus Omnitrophota bacterium]